MTAGAETAGATYNIHGRRNLVVCLVCSFSTLVAMTLLLPFLPLYVEELGAEGHAAIVQWSGIAYGATFFAAALVAPLWGRLGDRYGRKVMLVRASFGMAVCMSLMGMVQSVWQLVALRLLIGLAGGYSSGSTILVAMQTPKERSGWALGTLSAGIMAGNLVGPLVGGALPPLIGIRMTFLLSGGIIFLALQKRGSGDTISAAFASVGLLFASTSFVLYWFGTSPLRLDFLSGLWRVGGAMVSKQGSFNAIVSCCLALAVMGVFRYTTVGHLLTASAISARNAELTGIPVKKLQLSTFAVSGTVAGIAGVLMVFTRGMSYDLSFGLTLSAFGAMIVLGTASIATIFLGGVVLGVIEAVATGYLPAAYASLAPLLFILVTLVAGRFGGEKGGRP